MESYAQCGKNDNDILINTKIRVRKDKMKIGDMVRIRRKKIASQQTRLGAIKWEKWWEDGGIIIEEYQVWKKTVTVLHKGKIEDIPARDVQLVSRNRGDK